MTLTVTRLDHDPEAAKLIEALYAAATAAVAHALPDDCHDRTAELLRRGARIDVTVELPSSDVTMWLDFENRRVELARVVQAVGGTA